METYVNGALKNKVCICMANYYGSSYSLPFSIWPNFISTYLIVIIGDTIINYTSSCFHI